MVSISIGIGRAANIASTWDADGPEWAAADPAGMATTTSAWATADTADTVDTSEDTDATDESCCRACNENHPWDKGLEIRCGCFYCTECLECGFKSALKQHVSTAFSCCLGRVRFQEAQPVLSKTLRRQFEAMLIEIRNADNTVYCHKPKCSTYIKPHSVHNGNGYCQKCRAVTCAKCKNARHDGPCELSEGQKMMQGVTKENGWCKCPECKAVVELVDGCNHMLCICGCEFCYSCGKENMMCSCVDEQVIELANEAFPGGPVFG